jgi:hypothetical protein
VQNSFAVLDDKLSYSRRHFKSGAVARHESVLRQDKMSRFQDNTFLRDQIRRVLERSTSNPQTEVTEWARVSVSTELLILYVVHLLMITVGRW